MFYVLPCVILFLCFSVLLALRLPRLGKRELILVLFVRFFDLCLFGFVGFLFLLVPGKGCDCDCGTPWTFLLPFDLVFYVLFSIIQDISRQWKDDDGRLCAMKRHKVKAEFRLQRDSNLGSRDSKLGVLISRPPGRFRTAGSQNRFYISSILH